MKGIARFLIIATAIALVVRYAGFETFRVASDSMAPNLLLGDWFLVSKLDFSVKLPFATYEIIKIRRPRFSEMVAFTLPDQGLETFVKRVVGVAGDTVEIRKGRLSVNGVSHKYEPIVASNPPEPLNFWEVRSEHEKYQIQRDGLLEGDDYGPVDIPQGYFFALSDNRGDRSDSRVWGPVPFSCLKGKVRLVLLSFNALGNLREKRTGRTVD